MTVDKLICNIQEMYGNYKPGMLVAIEKELDTCKESNIQTLWEAIKKYHSKSFPPTWWEIQQIAERSRIDIIKNDFTSLYVCGNCLTEYTLDESSCPNPKCETKGFSLPATCPWCFKKDIITKFDDSNGVQTKCLKCGNIRTYALIRRR